MRFPSKPKPEIVDESFVEAAPSAASSDKSEASERPRHRRGSKPRSSRVSEPRPASDPVSEGVLILKSFRIPLDLARRLEALARVITKTQTQIVVEATLERVAELEAEYQRRAGHPVPSPEIVRID